MAADREPEMSISEVSHGSPDYRECVELRRKILRTPLGLDFSAEEIDEERRDFHLACRVGGQLAGCLVLSPKSSSVIKMRQVAVDPAWQGRGIGRSLVCFSEALARQRHFSTMTLHARETAVPFYLKLGYDAVGEWFEEVTVPHREMRKMIHENSP